MKTTRIRRKIESIRSKISRLKAVCEPEMCWESFLAPAWSLESNGQTPCRCV